MSHTFTPNFLFRYLHTATITNYTLVTNTFVLTTSTLIILYRTKNAFAEQSITLGLVGTIVNRFRFQNLTMTALQYTIGAGQADGDAGEV